MAPSVKRLKENKTLKILYTEEKDRIIGIAPLIKSKRSFKKIFNYTVIEPLAKENTDYSGFILAENEIQSLITIIKYLTFQKDWDDITQCICCN